MIDNEPGRPSGKRDRLARLARVASVLQANPDGLHVREIARRVGVSVRTAYRDLDALDGELGLGVWNEAGVYGILAEGFLPPLKLTQAEAMAVVLSARLMARYADKYDPDLAAAFEKLEQGLPPVLAAYVEQTLRILAEAPRDERFRGHVHDLTRAWAERRVVEIDYEPARYSADRARRRARVRPYLIEPSLQTHALYLIGHDETKEAMRTFKIERIKAVTLTPRTFEPPSAGVIEGALRRAWDIIADQDPVRVVLRFAPSVAERVGETNWHPTQRLAGEADGAVRWSATVAGTIEIRLWILSWGDEVEVLEPAELRADVRATLERAAALYRGAGEAGR
jgi:proteasome accessory factor B